MTRTIVVAGYGPGISDAVARKFGTEGFAVALVARNEERVKEGARNLAASGIAAEGFSCDLGDTAAVTSLVADVKATLGPVTVLHWNAYAGLAGDLTTASVDDLKKTLDVGVHGLVAALQAALPDMKAQKDAAVLVTGGGFSTYDAKVDTMIVQWNAMGLAVAKAAQHKLAGLLHQKLAGDGIYVGEVVVMGMVKGTAFDSGHATLEPSTVADKFWSIYQGRSEISVACAG
jgi:NADP-dependent 3-hydroxy acid dehydrogenase YdfG